MKKEKPKIDKEKIIVLVFGILILINLYLIPAAPPFSTSLTNGFTVQVPPITTLKVGEGFAFEFHVFNISNGIERTTGVSCNFHLYNASGHHIYKALRSTVSDDLDYSFNVSGGNFSTKGEYWYYVACNSSTLGGFSGDLITVNPTGTIPSTFQGTMYIIIWIVSIMILIGLLVAGIKLPSRNNSNEMTGYIIAVNNLKYLKMLCLAFAYLTAMFLTYFTWMVSYAYLEMEFMTLIFRDLFYGLAVAVLPLFIVGAVIVIANIVRDAKIQDWLSRGLGVKDE